MGPRPRRVEARYGGVTYGPRVDTLSACGRGVPARAKPPRPTTTTERASLVAEIENYVWGGLTEVEALRAATSVAAEALNMAGELGTLAGGALADMLIVDGNPLEDIEDLRNARVVIKDGVAYRLEDLLRPPRALVP